MAQSVYHFHWHDSVVIVTFTLSSAFALTFEPTFNTVNHNTPHFNIWLAWHDCSACQLDSSIRPCDPPTGTASYKPQGDNHTTTRVVISAPLLPTSGLSVYCSFSWDISICSIVQIWHQQTPLHHDIQCWFWLHSKYIVLLAFEANCVYLILVFLNVLNSHYLNSCSASLSLAMNYTQCSSCSLVLYPGPCKIGKGSGHTWQHCSLCLLRGRRITHWVVERLSHLIKLSPGLASGHSLSRTVHLAIANSYLLRKLNLNSSGIIYTLTQRMWYYAHFWFFGWTCVAAGTRLMPVSVGLHWEGNQHH